MKPKYFFGSLLVSIILFTGLWIGFGLRQLELLSSSQVTPQTLGYTDYLAQYTCQEPPEGCGMYHYWDYDSCSCMYEYTCTEPSSGCGTNYYWDPNSCSCIYSGGCSEPSGGCGSNYYWDSNSCSCVYQTAPTGSCTPPSAGCSTNYYWDYLSCSCIYSGGCSEPTGGCDAHHYWDQASCSCLYDGSCNPPSTGCGTNYYYDYGSCTCIYSCSPPAAGCGTNYYWDLATCSCKPSTTCSPPATGCGSNYYWDYNSCSCKSYTSCTQPAGGCGTGYYWDSYSCSCKSSSSCNPPSSGCGANYYWDSYSCKCKASCSEPSGGCGTNYYWDYGSCTCRSSNSCNPPATGCGTSHYWDSYYCSCKPYQVSTTSTTCSPPAAGCGSNFYWDSYSCNCKQYPTDYGCNEPTGGCGNGWYWDKDGCICKSTDNQTYYSYTSYTPYIYEQNFDRLAYEPPEKIKCIKGILTPTEYERLRYLVATSDKERDEVRKLWDKVQSCWESTTAANGLSGETAAKITGVPSVSKIPFEAESCLIKALGEIAYREISQGKREPAYQEHIKFEVCFGQVSADTVGYITEKQSIPKTVDTCLKNVLGDLYVQINSGKANVPPELRKKVDRCFGVDPQPFVQGRVYKVPEEIRDCLRQSVNEARFNEISSGKTEPTSEEKKKAEACFAKLNENQLKFLPPPPEQVPFLETQPEKIKFAEFKQETKKYGDKTVGGKVTFSGKGTPNSVVNIYIYSEPIVVTTKTDENGDWVYELNQPLKGEKHIAYATVKDEEGRVVRSSVFDFTVVAAEEDMARAYLEESEATEVQSNFLKYAFIIIGVAVVVVMGTTTFIYLKKMNLVESGEDLGKKKTKLLRRPDRNSKSDTSSGSIN